MNTRWRWGTGLPIRRRWIAAILAGAVLSGAVACSMIGSGSSPAALPTTRAVVVSFVTPDPDDLYLASIARGIRTALTELGGKLVEVTASGSPAAETEKLLADGRPDAIILAPGISAGRADAMCRALGAVRAAGTKVVTLEPGTDSSCRDLVVDPATDEDIAQTLADIIGTQLRYGEVGVVAASTDTSADDKLVKLIKRRLAKAHPSVGVAAVARAKDAATASAAAAGLIRSHELRGIIATTPEGLVGAARQVSRSSAKGQVAVTGLGRPNSVRDYVANGTITTFALWDPAELGYLAAYAAQNLAKGTITGAEGDAFTAGKLMRTEVQAGATVVLGEPFRFDDGNIHRFDF